MTKEQIEQLARQKAAELPEEVIVKYIGINEEIMRKHSKRTNAYKMAKEAREILDLALGYKFWM